ncbi:hypothetical protein BH11MYX3_BH11MYX3_16810 [soil metagenome]
MRPHLAWLWLATSLGGCSLLYNPSNIGEPMDARPIDAPPIFDADPSMLTLTKAFPSFLYEGTGEGGSRPAVLVIEGMHMVPGNTTVTITKAAAATKTPLVVVDNAGLKVEANGLRLAVPVTVTVDPLVGNETVALDITVSQDSPVGRISKTLTGMVTLQGFPEILPTTTTLPTLMGGVNEFSKVQRSTGTFTIASTTMPVSIRSRSSLDLVGVTTLSVSANANNPGPGGFAGGPGGSTVSPAGAGMGPAPGAASGGAAGFTTDPTIFTLGVPFRGSGGGGGQGAATTGGPGGGGGGSIELSAAGDLKVGNINAKGGTPPANLNIGGGGSGGVIVLRAGHDLEGGVLDVAGTGTAAPGRVRYDAGGTVTLAGAAMFFRGAMFVDPPLITTTATPTINVSGTKLTSFKYYILNATGQVVNGPFTGNVPDNGPASITFGSGPTDRLFDGLNRVCLVLGTGDASSETRNCADIAFVYQP